jgi:hypothetical protein
MPVLAPCDFFLNSVKGKRFQDVVKIQWNTIWRLQAIPGQAYYTCNEKR